MGIDWEQILGSNGNDLEHSYDEAVSRHVYADERPPIADEDEISRLPWDEV